MRVAASNVVSVDLEWSGIAARTSHSRTDDVGMATLTEDTKEDGQSNL